MEVTDKNYSELVAKGDLLVLDFWATWCGPCMALAPTMEQIEKDYAGKPVVVGKVNVDENEDLTDKFSIRNVPTILFIKNGEVVDKCVGAVLKNVITEKINALI
ncbi:MAG: thioredoxin [Paludibacteraceae bacterium]|nr:thioredoxin [Candidatus Physcocola equi]MCQ2233982.1 thioredoxin [Paludibacteraceae bacterium]